MVAEAMMTHAGHARPEQFEEEPVRQVAAIVSLAARRAGPFADSRKLPDCITCCGSAASHGQGSYSHRPRTVGVDDVVTVPTPWHRTPRAAAAAPRGTGAAPPALDTHQTLSARQAVPIATSPKPGTASRSRRTPVPYRTAYLR